MGPPLGSLIFAGSSPSPVFRGAPGAWSAGPEREPGLESGKAVQRGLGSESERNGAGGSAAAARAKAELQPPAARRCTPSSARSRVRPAICPPPPAPRAEPPPLAGALAPPPSRLRPARRGQHHGQRRVPAGRLEPLPRCAPRLAESPAPAITSHGVGIMYEVAPGSCWLSVRPRVLAPGDPCPIFVRSS